jgi:hypothetical protein
MVAADDGIQAITIDDYAKSAGIARVGLIMLDLTADRSYRFRTS